MEVAMKEFALQDQVTSKRRVMELTGTTWSQDMILEQIQMKYQ